LLQLADVVPLLLRALRAPRVSTARAAILTYKELFQRQAWLFGQADTAKLLSALALLGYLSPCS
jgi:hypothetical protein